jgi:DNA-directed DNA polymerase III PolC
MSAFVPLRVRSHGSLLCGLASPEALVESALERGYTALALTDRDNLYLAVRFYREALAHGLRPLLGAELTSGPHTMLLLPVDRRGYANLCRLLTLRHLEPAFEPIAAVGELARGLQVIVESPGLAASLLQAGVRAARGEIAGVPIQGDRRNGDVGLWLGVRGLPSERPRLGERVAAARTLGVPLVATGDVTLLAPADHDAHRAAVTAARGELLERMSPDAFAAREAWLAAPREWQHRVRAVCAGAGVPEAGVAALANNLALAERCRVELELGTPIFPRAPVPDGETRPGYLLGLGRAGIERRYPRHADRPQALARLEHELALIERLGFTDYFLLVADIVEFARSRGIPSVGRGSGAGSLVAYVLGITNVDPLRYGLYFERFLHPARRDCPDLDIDLCWVRRDDVIAHVYETYGQEQVAMISTHATLGARSAFRETAKVLGVPNARVNALAKRVPHELDPPYLDHLRRTPGAGAIDWTEPPLRQALALAEKLAGVTRHLSIHCGGVVIGDRPLTYYVPLERAAKGIVVTQFEMRAIEAIGLVKMDLLGNRALTEIGDTVELVRRHRGVVIDVERLPDPEPATAQTLASGDTMSCFQLESPAMRHLLRMLRARTLDDTIAAVALVRPGPAESGMKEAFCRRHRGLEPVSYLHPRLERTLAGTHGVMLYEEDVMTVAAALTGLSLAEGDQLRRAIAAARGDEEFRALERGFVGHARRAGVDGDTARAVWRELTRFAAYAFCKAHAAGYGALAYQCAYLRAHFPTEFAVALLNHHAGMYATWVHVEDLRRRGVTFLAPCVNRSEWNTTLEGGGTEHAAVRIGLSRIAGLSQATGARIVVERETRRFATLADFADRTRPSADELEALILSGALDGTRRTRPSLLLEARTSAGALAHRGGARPALATVDGTDVRPEPVAPIAVPELPDFDVEAKVDGEIRASGLWFSGHPLDTLVSAALSQGATAAAELERRVGRRATIVGLPCAYRRVETKQGGLMLFLTLADRTGVAECVLFPDAYRAFASAARGQVVRAEGRVDETLGAVTLTVERLTALDPASRPPTGMPDRSGSLGRAQALASRYGAP